MTTVYGTAKKPAAPAPNISAGTATNVYAVYRSPPSRNQVIHEPKLRPPRPHSSRCMRPSARRNREAAKPMTATSRKSTSTTTSSTTLMSSMSALPVPLDGVPGGAALGRAASGHPVDQRRGGHAEHHEGELEPVEPRPVEERRVGRVVERHEQGHDDRHE